MQAAVLYLSSGRSLVLYLKTGFAKYMAKHLSAHTKCTVSHLFAGTNDRGEVLVA